MMGDGNTEYLAICERAPHSSMRGERTEESESPGERREARTSQEAGGGYE
jgi:hypothetical protein